MDNNSKQEAVNKQWKEAKIIEKYGLQNDPSKINRATRKKVLKRVQDSINTLVAVKNRNLKALADFHLTVNEIEQAMKGTYTCTGNGLQAARANKLAKRLLELNEELTILAQYKAKANAIRDARSHKPIVPDAELLPHGSPTGPSNTGT